MTDLDYARWQMGTSLGFHIVFAAIGIAMPLFMVIAEIRWRRTGDPVYLALTKTWAKGTAILFAVGAVSGTVLSFELGLLFPTFMKHAGAVIGMPFSLEGFAFFTEAIFLGVYLYGWERVRPRVHIAAGIVVAVSGVASAVFVLIANAWMNAPVGFTIASRSPLKLTDIDPIAAMGTPFAAHEIAHMVLAAYMATGFAVAGVHAWALRRAQRAQHPERAAFHQKALGIALGVALPCALLQPIVGHWSGQVVAKYQPMKLAAMEQLMKTQARAPLTVGPIEIPAALSVMAFNDPDAVVRGLEEVPPADRPSPVVRYAFQGMVALGSLMALVALWALVRRLRKKGWHDSRWFSRALIVCAPLGFIATELGWIVTEVGRQPWTITGVLRTADAVTPMPGLLAPFISFTVLYLGLAATVAVILWGHIKRTAEVA